jgi:hypothetical protein
MRMSGDYEKYTQEKSNLDFLVECGIFKAYHCRERM